MLDAAFVSWISTIGERGFDAFFLCLLRAQGFFDIHFTHGPYEFGKDIIAKHPHPEPTQYAFQLKAGDISGTEWTAILGQLEELIDTYLTHPNFDTTAPKTFVLCTTGRLKGKAILGSKQFQERVRENRKASFDVWEIDQLLEMLKGREHFGLLASPSAELPRIVGKIAAQDTTDRELEDLLAAFIPSSTTSLTQVYRNTLDNAICIDSLIRQDMPFQAMTAALSGVRIAATLAYSAKGEAHELMTEAMRAFIRLGDAQFSDLLSHPTDTERWFKWIGGAAEQIITYPVTCLRIIEFLGLASLYARHIGQPTETEKYAHLCDAVVSSQEGCFHPISDRYAASLIPPLIALYASGRASTATRLLRGVTKWVCDQYERSDFGLAGPHSTPEEEVRQFLGYAFDWIDLQPRRDSLIAVALIDFAYVFLPEQYELILNEFLAVNTLPATLHALDAPQSLTIQGGGIQSLFNIKYPPAPQNELLAHHRLQPTPRTPECVGGPVALLALACLARDRLFSDCYPRLKATLDDKT